jgi:hypothetical protein
MAGRGMLIRLGMGDGGDVAPSYADMTLYHLED